MEGFKFKDTGFKGAYLITNFYAGDNRGGFTKNFEKDIYGEAGIHFSLNETFTSRSMKNVIRGLHFQLRNPQAKLVSVVSGKVWDVIVDLRNGSSTFKQWRGFELSADNHMGLYIPKGFAHGFASLEDHTIMLYQCDGKYDAETDTGILFDEPEISVNWPIETRNAIHSQRDLNLMDWDAYINSLDKDPGLIFGGR